jgi:hypothetical protein
MKAILAGLALLALPLAARADESVELRWRWEKGQVYQYLLKHREVRTAAVLDQKLATTTETEYELQWTVKDIDDQGTATIEQKLTALRISSNGKDWDFAYDSSRGNEATEEYKKKLIQLYDQVRFTTYRLKLKADGTVAEVHGFDKLLNEISGNLGTDGLSVLDFEGINLRDDSFGWFLQQLLGTLPRGAVARGAQWSQPVQAKLAHFGELTGKNDFTLGSAVKVGDRSCREVSWKGAQSLETSMKWVGNNILRGTLKASKLTGTMRFDPAAGRLANSEVQAELDGTLKLGPNDKPLDLKVSFQHTLSLEAKP